MWKLVATRRAVAAATTTTTTTTTTACRSVARRALSAADLSHLVSNVTSDKIAADPELEAFMKANFPQSMNPNYVPVEPPHKKGQPRRRAAAGSSLAVATDDAIPQQESSSSESSIARAAAQCLILGQTHGELFRVEGETQE